MKAQDFPENPDEALHALRMSGVRDNYGALTSSEVESHIHGVKNEALAIVWSMAGALAAGELQKETAGEMIVSAAGLGDAVLRLAGHVRIAEGGPRAESAIEGLGAAQVELASHLGAWMKKQPSSPAEEHRKVISDVLYALASIGSQAGALREALGLESYGLITTSDVQGNEAAK